MKTKELLKESYRVVAKFGPQPQHEKGNVNFSNAQLISLEGGPLSTDSIYACNVNLLKSLKGGPQIVGKDFWCNRNYLESLEGGPGEVGRDYDCSSNILTSLKGAPKKIGRHFSVSQNTLTSLEFAPEEIGHDFYCHDNKLESLEGIHKRIKYIGNCAYFSENPIKSHVLGLLRIKGLKGVELDREDVMTIINKYLGGDRDIFACQEELIEAGYEDYAQL